MTRPQRYLTRMAVFVAMVATIAALLSPALYRFFMGNPAVNGVILSILLAGILYIFHQVMLLNPEVAWLERFRRNQANQPNEQLPRLLAPMATMLADRRGGRVSLSAMSMRTLLDGIGTRLDETRETSRYLIGLLVFLGLLGTFYGLLETVQSVGGVIGSCRPAPATPYAPSTTSRRGLQSPLGGMSTAFSASLFGLAGSLVLGFLDLQAGLAQNRFYQRSRGVSLGLYPAVRRRAGGRCRRRLGARLHPGAARADRRQPRQSPAHHGPRRGEPHLGEHQSAGADRAAGHADRPDARRADAAAAAGRSAGGAEAGAAAVGRRHRQRAGRP